MITTFFFPNVNKREPYEEMATFKSLLGVQVHLLCLGDFFKNFLDDNPVINPNVTLQTVIHRFQDRSAPYRVTLA